METEMPRKSLELSADRCWHCQIFLSPRRAVPGIHFLVSTLFGAFQPCPVLLSYLCSCKMDQMCGVLHNIFILRFERQFASINLETGQ